MSKPISGRRIKVDVRLTGGRIKLDLTEPTDGQLQRITALLEEWLDEEDAEELPPAAEAPTPPAPTEHRDLLDKVTGTPEPAPTNDKRAAKRALCGVLDGVTGHRCRRYAGHTDDRHGWWGKGADSHTWTDTITEPERDDEPPVIGPVDAPTPESKREDSELISATAETVEDDAVGLQLGDEAPLADQITEHAATAERAPTPPGVHLCRCGHAERLHELDGNDRGVCSRRVCGCAEYRAAA